MKPSITQLTLNELLIKLSFASVMVDAEFSKESIKEEIARRVNANEIVLDEKDSSGQTASEKLLKIMDDPQIILVLLQKGAKTTADQRIRFLRLAEQKNHLQLIDYLLEQGIASDKNSNGENALHFAESEQLLRRLVAKGADLENKSLFNGTPLQEAIMYHRNEKCRVLIELGANCALTNNKNQTLLHQACLGRNFVLAKLLLEQGIDPNVRDAQEKVALELLKRGYIKNNAHEEATTLVRLINATLKKTLENALELLFIAVEFNNVSVAQALLNHGLSYSTEDFNQALLEAARLNSPEMLKWLVEKGADVNFQDSQGNTALHHVSLSGDFEAGRFLLEHGANASIVNRQQQSPLARLFCLNHEKRYPLEMVKFAEVLLAHMDENGLKANGTSILDEALASFFEVRRSVDSASYLSYLKIIWPFIASLIKRNISLQYEEDLAFLAADAKDFDTLDYLSRKNYQCLLRAAQSIVRFCDIDSLKKLRRLGFDLNAKNNFYNNGDQVSFVQYVISCVLNEKNKDMLLKRLAFLEFILRKSGIALDFIGIGHHLLQAACQYGWTNILRILLSPLYAFPVNFVFLRNLYTNSVSLLEIAVLNNQPEVIEVLISHGADIHGLNNKESLLSFALSKSDGNNEQTINLLLDKNVAVNPRDIEKAISNNKVSMTIIERLIESIPLDDFIRIRPLHLAIEKNRMDVFDFCLNTYAEFLIGLRNNLGYTAIFRAVENKNVHFYNRLLAVGGAKETVACNGNSLTLYAFYRNKHQILNLSMPTNFDNDAFNQIASYLKDECGVGAEFFCRYYSYRLLMLLRSRDNVGEFIRKFKGTGIGAIHDLCVFPLPKKALVYPEAWAQLALVHGPELTKYFARAYEVEQKIGRAPQNLDEIKEALKDIVYARHQENPELSRIFARYFVSEDGFERVLDKYQEKSLDNMPDVYINGDEVGHPTYYFKKLASNDPRGFILGAITACCQSIGSQGEECVWYGMESSHAGFYVICEKRNEAKIADKEALLEKVNAFNDIHAFRNALPKGERKKFEQYLSIEQLVAVIAKELEELLEEKIIAQSLAWLNQQGEFVFDSWERRYPQHDQLFEPFYKAAASQLIAKHGISRVLVGSGGQTPQESCFNEVDESDSAKPTNYEGYRDSSCQRLIAAATPLLTSSYSPGFFDQQNQETAISRLMDYLHQLTKNCPEIMVRKLTPELGIINPLESYLISSPKTTENASTEKPMFIQPCRWGKNNYAIFVCIAAHRTIVYLDSATDERNKRIKRVVDFSRLKDEYDYTFISNLSAANASADQISWLIEQVDLVLKPFIERRAHDYTSNQLRRNQN